MSKTAYCRARRHISVGSVDSAVLMILACGRERQTFNRRRSIQHELRAPHSWLKKTVSVFVLLNSGLEETMNRAEEEILRECARAPRSQLIDLPKTMTGEKITDQGT